MTSAPAPGPAPGSASPTPVRGAWRWLRGTYVGLAGVALAAAGHTLGGGTLPAPRVLAAIAAAAVLVGVALSGRRWGLGSLLVVLLVLQGAYHVAFTSPAEAMAGMSHEGGPGLAMLAGHVGAALLTAVVLRRGEDWCWSLVELLTRPLWVTRLAVVPVDDDDPFVPVAWSRPAPAQVLLSAGRSRRGPPPVCVA